MQRWKQQTRRGLAASGAIIAALECLRLITQVELAVVDEYAHLCLYAFQDQLRAIDFAGREIRMHDHGFDFVALYVELQQSCVHNSVLTLSVQTRRHAAPCREPSAVISITEHLFDLQAKALGEPE